MMYYFAQKFNFDDCYLRCMVNMLLLKPTMRCLGMPG